MSDQPKKVISGFGVSSGDPSEPVVIWAVNQLGDAVSISLMPRAARKLAKMIEDQVRELAESALR